MCRKISVIIPSYNSKFLLEKCLDSLLNQTYKNIEIIVIDDGSNDGTESMIKNKYMDKIVYIKQQNFGVSYARNAGIEIANGDFIFFIDADDTIECDALNELLQEKNKHNLTTVHHRNVYSNGKQSFTKSTKNNYCVNEFIDEVLSGNMLGVVWGYLFDSSIVKKIKFDINTSYLEDTLFLMEYLKKSDISEIKLIDDSNTIYNYFINDKSATSISKNVLKKCKNFIYSLNKIDELLERKYHVKIETKKVALLEKEMRLCKGLGDYKEICTDIKIDDCTVNKAYLHFFKFMYVNNQYIMMKIYYFIRKFLKNVVLFTNLREAPYRKEKYNKL